MHYTASHGVFRLKCKKGGKTGIEMLPCELYPRVNESTLLMNAADAALSAIVLCVCVDADVFRISRLRQVRSTEWHFFVVIFISRMPSRAELVQ